MLSVTKKGKEGAEEILVMMNGFRNCPPIAINGSQVIRIVDYQLKLDTDLLSGKKKNIDLPKSDVLQFFTEDGSKISIRPSGTEPKIKFYFGVKGKLDIVTDFEKVSNQLNKKIEDIIKDLGIK